VSVRSVFQIQVQMALDQAGSSLAALWPDAPPALAVVRRDQVPEILASWKYWQLNWPQARRDYNRVPRSCYIGLQMADGTVPVLALIRVSAAHVHTSLLYVEKNAGVLEPGMAMTVIDAALQLVAAAFASTRIIIAAPRQSLVDYYRDEFGYKLAKKRERKTAAMFKDVEVQ